MYRLPDRNAVESRKSAQVYQRNVSYLTLKIEAIRSSRTLVYLNRTVRSYIPDDIALRLHQITSHSRRKRLLLARTKNPEVRTASTT
jgi:hypothetical protein